jgi:hypothetical protein
MDHKLSTKYAAGGRKCEGYEEPCKEPATHTYVDGDRPIPFCALHYARVLAYDEVHKKDHVVNCDLPGASKLNTADVEFVMAQWTEMVRALGPEASTCSAFGAEGELTLSAGFEDSDDALRFILAMEKLTGQKLYSINGKPLRKPN